MAKKNKPTRKNMDGRFNAWLLKTLYWIEKTGSFEIKNIEAIDDNTIIGFWHTDIYGMQLVLREVVKRVKKVNIIVTTKKRGDRIEAMIAYNGGNAVRTPDGMEMRKIFKEIIEVAKTPDEVLAVALDGPDGPIHEPKKLSFLMAKESGKKMVYIKFHYTRFIHSRKRWDKLRCPLPWSRFWAEVVEIGPVDKVMLANFKEYKENITWE